MNDPDQIAYFAAINNYLSSLSHEEISEDEYNITIKMLKTETYYKDAADALIRLREIDFM